MRTRSGNFTVIGTDTDGCLVCRDHDTNEEYNCGETLEEFGPQNLTEEERKTLTAESAERGKT